MIAAYLGMHRHSIILEGVLVGLCGAAAVAIWFLIYDAAAGVPLRTPALLWAAFFEHARDPAAAGVTLGRVLKYTAVHGAVFIGFGIAASGLFSLVDRDRRVLFAVFMLFCCFEVAFLAVVAVVFQQSLSELEPWAILTGNAVAAFVMLSLLFWRHRRSPAELLEAGE